jgi:transposase-like protein
MMSASARVSVKTETADAARRRRHSVAEKRWIVEATLAAGTSVARVLREHGVNANLVFSWRRLYQRGLGDNATTPLLRTITSEACRIARAAELGGG